MPEQKYSAGMVSKGFWFQEFKKYLELKEQEKTDSEIKEIQNKENIFLAPSIHYGKRMIGEISRRRKALPQEIVELFINLNIQDQKVVNLLGIMMTDRLFFEYIYEIYREAIILGTIAFDDAKTRIFFKEKSEQSEKVANFTDQTKRRLAAAYKTYLKEANLLKEEKGILIYNKPIINTELEKGMEKASLHPYLKALMGVM